MVVAPQQPALPGHGGEEGDVVALPEHGHAVERGEQREGDGLEVAILAGEQRDAAADGEAEQVGRHPRHTPHTLPSHHITSRHISTQTPAIKQSFEPGVDSSQVTATHRER